MKSTIAKNVRVHSLNSQDRWDVTRRLYYYGFRWLYYTDEILSTDTGFQKDFLIIFNLYQTPYGKISKNRL